MPFESVIKPSGEPTWTPESFDLNSLDFEEVCPNFTMLAPSSSIHFQVPSFAVMCLPDHGGS